MLKNQYKNSLILRDLKLKLQKVNRNKKLNYQVFIN